MLMSPVLAYGSPLGLQWGKDIPDSYMEYKDYRYLWGDSKYGEMRFLGWLGEDFRSEVLLVFAGKKIGKAYLILGPDGITDNNCFKQYGKVVAALNKKYGHYYRKNLMKESLIDDLVFVSECYAMRVGVAEIETKWKTDKFEINAFMFSDENELFIEIEYIYLPLKKIKTENLHEHL